MTLLCCIERFSLSNDIIPSDKGDDVVIMDSTPDCNKIIELLNYKNKYKQISLRTINKTIVFFNKFNKKN